MKKGERKMFSTSKKMIVAGILTLSMLGVGATSALAEEAAPSADASVSLLSKYVWRGFEFSDDSIVIQPSLSVSYMGFGANLWANLDTELYGTTNKWNETDMTLSYDGAVDKLGYGVGYIYYALDSANDTQEIYGTLSYDTLLSPSLALYYDIDEFSGDWYANLSIGHSFELSEAMSLDLGFAAGYYYVDDGDYSEFHDGLISAALSIPVGQYVTISPELYYSFPLSDKASDVIEANSDALGGSGDDSYVYGGVSLSFAF